MPANAAIDYLLYLFDRLSNSDFLDGQILNTDKFSYNGCKTNRRLNMLDRFASTE